MAMNAMHRRLCRSDRWAERMHGEVMPWALEGLDLGGDVLEIGPGYGVTTRWLVGRAGSLTAAEVDPKLATDLDRRMEGRVDVHTADGARLPFRDASFDVVVCFTMLHHVPSPAQQDRVFAEAARVLRLGGVFAGSDSLRSLPFRLLHVGDTMVVVDPATMPERLHDAGFPEASADAGERSFRFRAGR